MAAFGIWTNGGAVWETAAQGVWLGSGALNETAGTAAASGTLAVTLAALTLAATGTSPISGALAKTLGAATLSAAGTVVVSGSLAKTLAPVTLSTTGGGEVSGTLAVTLAPLTLSSVNLPISSGVLSKTLGAVTLSATGTIPASGALTATLGAVTLRSFSSANVAPLAKGRVRVRGVRTPIPGNAFAGRPPGAGTGAAVIVKFQEFAQYLLATGVIAPPGAAAPLAPIATHTILANPTGSTAAPIATTLPNAAAGITWTYGATSITVTLANDLAALEGLGSTGLAARTATDTWAQRTITGTASRLTVTNGDGVAGDPTLDISASYVGQTSITTLGTIGTGTWQGTKIGLAYGGTNADLSATGGTSQVLKQSSTGAAITVGQLAASDLSNGVTGSGAVVLANTPTLITPIIGAATGTSLDLSSFLTLDPASKPAGAAASPTFYGISGIGFGAFLGTTGKVVIFDLRGLTADRAFSFPDNAGAVVTTGDTGTVTDAMLAAPITATRINGYTVAGLPAGTIGDIAYVTDQLTAPAAKGVAPVGGGAVACLVFRNATGWVGA